MRCEDFPCCGHTNDDPCGPQPYDAPDYYDTTKNPHALCDHEYGECNVDYYDDEPYDAADCEHGDGSYKHVGEPCWSMDCTHEMTFECDRCYSEFPARGDGNGWANILVSLIKK